MKIIKNIAHIVIRSTGTQPAKRMEQLKQEWGELSPCHYVIKANGDVKKLSDEKKNAEDNCIHIAYIGGIDKNGKPKDTRTRAQEDSMFDLIVKLSDTYSAARTIGYDEHTGKTEDSPGFDVKTWLANYEPDFQSAA